jgi:ankyrin repeat protein
VDGIDGQANWPLVVAAYSGHAEAVRQLLFWGADVNKARTDYGWPPLYLAAKRGPSQAAREVVRLLLDGEPDVNKATTDTGSTPLYKAAAQSWACGDGAAAAGCQWMGGSE